MPIDTIRNNTGGVLKLWDGNTPLATLQQGAAAHTLSVTITRVAVGNTGYGREHGSFQNNRSYIATLEGHTVTFDTDEPSHQVRFSA